jgi:uncharacterized protein
MRVLVSGASGLVGRHLCRALEGRHAEIVRLVRREPRSADEVRWDPSGGRLDGSSIERFDAVVHLAGETVAGRWSDTKKRGIFDSRVHGTKLLAETLAALRDPPPVLVSASGVGFYGAAGDTVLNESSPGGNGYLADVSRAWEAATAPAAMRGIRVVHARLGLVLAKDGGALAQMLPLFRLGLGGRLGDGRQWMSWIDVDDLVEVLLFVIDHAAVSGAVNAVAPHPVRNDEFTATLGRVLGRPTLLAVPAFALRLALGEAADEMLLGSTRVEPQVLERLGFAFRHPELEGSLQHLLVGGA